MRRWFSYGAARLCSKNSLPRRAQRPNRAATVYHRRTSRPLPRRAFRCHNARLQQVPGLYPLFTASCAGGSSILPNGCGTSSKYRSASRPLGMSCGPWAIANSRPGRAIWPSGLRISSFLKRVPCPSGANPHRPPKRHAHRAVVARRRTDWPTDQANPPLGAARNPTNSAQRPAPGIGMDLWRHLPRRGQRCSAGHAPL